MKLRRLITKPLSRNARVLIGAAILIPAVIIASCLVVLILGGPSIWRPDFHYPEHPSQYYTAREALATALPQIPSWREDGLVTFAYHRPGDTSVWGVRADGRAPIWSFSVSSPSTMTRTTITLIDDVAFVSGFDGHPELPLRHDPTPLPLDWVIDTDQAIALATAAGAEGLPTMIEASRRSQIDADGGRAGDLIPFAWLLGYGERGGGPFVLVDAYSGLILQNDFDPP